MTNISSTTRRYGALVGVVGEYLAAKCFRDLDWSVLDEEVFGGQRRHYDFRATAPDGKRSVQVSVKTSTRFDGYLTWQMPGTETVAPWIAAATAAGEKAIVLGLHVEHTGPVQAVPGGFFFPTPRVIEYGALDAATWGRMVDERRAEYGATPRKNGTGMLSPENLRLPVPVHKLDYLHNVLRYE